MYPSEIAESYLSERIVSPLYERHVRSIAGRLRELSANEINAYLRMRLSSVTATTVSNERRIIRTLWRWAYDTGVVDDPPRALLRVSVPRRPVEAWSVGEIASLVKAASIRPGGFQCGVTRHTWLTAWVRLSYDTGARHGDVFSWTQKNLKGNAVRWTIHKTGIAAVRVLSDETMDAVESLLAERRQAKLREREGSRPLVGGLCCRRWAFAQFRKLLEDVGLDGSGRWLRRSAATHVEMQQRGAAKVFLAHLSPGLADRCYIDASQVQQTVLVPPRITVPAGPSADGPVRSGTPSGRSPTAAKTPVARRARTSAS